MRSNVCIFLLLLICNVCFAQMEQYNYKRELIGISDQWYKIEMPDDIFFKLSQNLYDIRIFGITTKGDTIESPYLLNIVSEKESTRIIDFKTINSSHAAEGYYYTFEVLTKETINQIKLAFNRKNFNWQIKLEGSLDQQKWFTIIKDYRILSIKNNDTDFQFTKLTFPESTYVYYRLLINAKESPELSHVSIKQQETIEGKYKNYPVKNWNSIENKKLKQTEIDIDLQFPLPVSSIKLNIDTAIDYYRPITIKYISDSIETEKGWKYNYKVLSTEILNSNKENIFQFESTILQKLRLIIHNQDNQSLSIGSIEAKAYVHEIIARFNEPAAYYLTYGNQGTKKANYDIKQFVDKIPDTLFTLELGEEQIILQPELSKSSPLFNDKKWLWVVMTLIIILLAGFTIKMMKRV